jgi:C-terminal processing protease CtpA/Prc
MNATQQGQTGANPRWRVLAVCLVAGAILVWGFRLNAQDGKGGNDKKEPAKAEKPAQPASPLQILLNGQGELMEDLLKTLHKPNGPNDDDMLNLMQKAMRLALAAANQQLAQGGDLNLNVGGDTDYLSQRLGLQLKPAGDDLAEQLDLPNGQGEVVVNVTPGSSAAQAGVQPSDILLELNGKPVSRTTAEFAKALEGVKSGDPVNAVVLRKGAKKEIKGLVLRDAQPAAQQQQFQQFQQQQLQFPALPQLNLQPLGPRGAGQGAGWPFQPVRRPIGLGGFGQ